MGLLGKKFNELVPDMFLHSKLSLYTQKVCFGNIHPFPLQGISIFLCKYVDNLIDTGIY